MKQHPLYLFIAKERYDYDGQERLSSGVLSSVQFVVDMLNSAGLHAVLATAVDANSIDALVDRYKPVAVVLEAVWVTPEKMAELIGLHSLVKWTVRAHSEIAFLAQEGCAVEWLVEFAQLGVEVAFNSVQTAADWRGSMGDAVCLPNHYPLRAPRPRLESEDALHVGCFGAIRPFKNQLMQAMAAVEFARRQGRPLVFHMNGGRVEQFGEANLKNIKAAIAASNQTLVLEPWLPHAEFLELVARMEICLQVSLTESFNIVSADAVSMGVPLVGSSAVSWLPRRSQAPANDLGGIVRVMENADRTSVAMNHEALEDYLSDARKTWLGWAR